MSNKLELTTYAPLPTQRQFHESDAVLRLYQGGVGAGKTLAGCWEALDVSMAYPRNFGLIARKTYRELEDSTKRTFFEICPPQLIKSYRARDDMVTLINDSVIIFRSLDDPNKFRSINLGWFYIDEASEIDDEDVANMLVGRLRLSHVPWRGGWFTSNPSHVEHWLHDWFVKRGATNLRYFMVTARTYDNPYLPKEYVEHLESEYSAQWIRRYLMGEFGFIIKGTPVFPNFNENLHVVKGLTWMPDRPIFRAWDFGWHHPAVLFGQVGPDRSWHLLHEMMGDKILINRFAEEVVSKSAQLFPGSNFIDVGDPAGNQHNDKSDKTSIQLLKEKHDITVTARRQPKKRVIELIDQRMTMIRKGKDSDVRPMLQVNGPTCPILVEGFLGGYAWPKAKDGKIYKEEPMEDGWFEHLQDCAQYMAAAIYLGGLAGDRIKIVEPRWSFN